MLSPDEEMLDLPSVPRVRRAAPAAAPAPGSAVAARGRQRPPRGSRWTDAKPSAAASTSPAGPRQQSSPRSAVGRRRSRSRSNSPAPTPRKVAKRRVRARKFVNDDDDDDEEDADYMDSQANDSSSQPSPSPLSSSKSVSPPSEKRTTPTGLRSGKTASRRSAGKRAAAKQEAVPMEEDRPARAVAASAKLKGKKVRKMKIKKIKPAKEPKKTRKVKAEELVEPEEPEEDLEDAEEVPEEIEMPDEVEQPDEPEDMDEPDYSNEDTDELKESESFDSSRSPGASSMGSGSVSGTPGPSGRGKRLTSRQRALNGEKVELEYGKLASPKHKKKTTPKDDWTPDEEKELKKQQKARLRQMVNDKRNKEKRAATVDKVLRGVTSKRKKISLANEAVAARADKRLTNKGVPEGCIRITSGLSGTIIAVHPGEALPPALATGRLTSNYPRACTRDPKTGKRIFT